jgi:hypothetical protein
VFGSNSDVAEHGARQLGEEAFDQIEPGAMLRGEGKFEAALWLDNEPGFGFLRSVGGMGSPLFSPSGRMINCRTFATFKG